MISYEKYLSPLGRNLHESVLRRMGQVIASRTGDLISFAAGYPDPVGFPWDESREIANEVKIRHFLKTSWSSSKDCSGVGSGSFGKSSGSRPIILKNDLFVLIFTALFFATVTSNSPVGSSRKIS